LPPATDLTPILQDIELGAADVRVVRLEAGGAPAVEAVRAAVRTGPALVEMAGAVGDPELARLRDALWPHAHLTAIYSVGAEGRLQRRALGGSVPLGQAAAGAPALVLYVRSPDEALGRDTTRAKFDANAGGWNGVPGSPTYGHFRWMRRLVSDVARSRQGQRVLDAGCGAGWVGIEAALAGASVSAFDPSPAMVEIARRNAAENHVPLDARVGFVEDVPFEQPFDVVLNSGVISFAPDSGVFLDRLDALLQPGGLLVIGDLNPLSRGFRRRRRRPLLPARELNGLPRASIEAMLAERGYRVEGRWYYQLSFPLPELMALSEQKWGGLGCGLALLCNRLATRLDHAWGSRAARWFDSWIVRARKAPGPTPARPAR